MIQHYTLEERKKIEFLVKSGFTNKEIAIALGRTSLGINAELRKCGGKKVYDAEKRHSLVAEGILRGQKKPSTLTKVEIDIIKKGIDERLLVSEICRLVRRSPRRTRQFIRSNFPGYKVSKARYPLCYHKKLLALEKHTQKLAEHIEELYARTSSYK